MERINTGKGKAQLHMKSGFSQIVSFVEEDLELALILHDQTATHGKCIEFLLFFFGRQQEKQ